MQFILCKNIKNCVVFGSKLPRRQQQIRRYAQAFASTRNENLTKLREQAMRPDSRMKWAQGGKEGGGWREFGEDALRIMYDKNLLENGETLTDVDFRVLKSVVRLLKLGYLDARDIEAQSSEAFEEMLAEEDTLDAALEQLTVAQNTELKWTQPLPSTVYKIFHEHRKLKTRTDQDEDWLDLADFIKSWNRHVAESPELGLEPIKSSGREAKDELVEIGLCGKNPMKRMEGLILWRELRPQRDHLKSKNEPPGTFQLLLTELPPRNLVSAIQDGNQDLLHTFRMQSLENMYDHRELRHLAIVLTKHVRDGIMSSGRDSQVKVTAQERFEQLQPTVKMLLQCFDVHDANELRKFRENEHKFVVDDASHPYVTHKTKLAKEAGKILKKLFKGAYNRSGERAGFTKSGLRDEELDELRSSDFFEEDAEEKQLQRAIRAEHLSRRTEVKDYFSTILDDTKVNDDFLDQDFDAVVEDSLSKQFDSQFRDGYQYTIRSRFKACPYTIPSFPMVEGKEIEISPWNVRYLSKFVNERGMVLPRRLTGVSIHAQLAITKAITKAKILRLMPTDKKFMFVDNRGLKKAQWIRMSTRERIANEPKIPALTREETEEKFGLPTYTFEEMEEKLEEIGMKFGMDVTQTREGTPYDDLSHEEKQKILKLDPDSFSEDAELPKTTDIDEVYGLKADEPEVQMHQMARHWRAKPRKDLQEQFQKKYVGLSKYWKELYAKEAKQIESV